MDNKNNIPLTGVPIGFNDNVSLSNNGGMLNSPIVNFSSEDLSAEPQSEIYKKSITAIVKHSGEITGYQLSNGEQITKQRGVELAKAGTISGVSVATSRKGEKYLRSLPDEDEGNNLSSLPIIEE